MKKVLSYVITFCLIAIVILMLIRNKKEINAQIAFAEQRVTAYPVKVMEVQRGTLNTSLEVAGILAATDDLMLMAETQGRVDKIYKKAGDWVERGTSIAQVNDELMRAELMVTEANYEKAKRDLERAKALSDGGAITQQQLEGLELNEKAALAKYNTSQKRVRDARITAPVSGYVNKLFIKQGGMIGPGVPVGELVNTRTLKMNVKVDEHDVVKIKPGQQVTIDVAALKDSVLTGSVISVGAKADYALQYEIEIVIPKNPGGKLKAGMVAAASFQFMDQNEGVVIPLNTLTGSTRDPRVFVLKEDIAHERAISIDYISEEQIKVRDGLREGEQLVTSGQFNLRDQMQVIIID